MSLTFQPSLRFRKWNSSKCNATIEYWYSVRQKKGVVKIVHEYGQKCQKCEKLSKPRFDLEATDKAMVIIVSRIKKVFYNEAPPANEHSGLHSQLTEPSNLFKIGRMPHDSSRCQACKQGKCSQASGFDHPGRKNSGPWNPPTHHGPKRKIGWKIILNCENLVVDPKTR